MRRIAFHASAPHYLAHLAPIWDAMPASVRGTFTVPDPFMEHATKLGIPAILSERAEHTAELVVVASLPDLVKLHRHQRAVLADHGAGQTYLGDGTATGDHGGWPGGPGRDAVDLFLCPSKRVADANAARYPKAATAVVGCPKLDRWVGVQVPAPSPRPTVALSFRWDCRLVPEARSAFVYYASSLRDLTRHGWQVLGHAHPRVPHEVWSLYETVGIEPVRDFEDVMGRASVFVADNTSCLWEFASTGRPVVALNAPWYRRDISHGLRFWDAIPGIECDEPADLVRRIATALVDPPGLRDQREQAVAYAYAHTDGLAAQRAVQAILEVARA